MNNLRAAIAKELHKPVRRNFPRRHVELKGVNDLYQADLVEMIPFSRSNKGYKYILTMINCFTKFAIAFPLKSKTASEVESVLKQILPHHPMKHFQTDQGTEWFNYKVKILLDKYRINHYHTFSEMKASIIERFNRTLKGMMWRKFSEQGNYQWLNLLPNLINQYNNTVHRTIGKKPKDVSLNDQQGILKKLVKSRQKTVHARQTFNVGERVRISRVQKVFSKGYWPQWSNEVYTVWKVQPTFPITYILKDDRGEILKGGFYKQELSKTKVDNTYLIEKVVRKKGDKLLVRWLGFDKTHDSWINKKDLI